MHAAVNLYDQVVYPNLAFPHTHPDRLAAMATLHGLAPAPVEHARVLEIACGDGANLIPMAYAIPAGEFVGFDLAGVPVERGQARISELGLKNIRIFQGDVLELGAELGRFDYIVAHGLYAWVPEPVRDRLMALCGELLTVEGVAFISYNALPGGYVRNAIRELMLGRAAEGEDAEQRVAGGIALVRSLLQARPDDDAYRILLEDHLKKMEERSPRAIFHDELSEANHPVEFVEFAAHAARHGLQYLSEAVLPPPPDPCYRYDVRQLVEEAAGGDSLKQEQMFDFVRARKYRETLLCRADRVVQREAGPEQFRRLLFSSPATSARGEGEGSTAFTLPGGIRMEASHPGPVALMRALEQAWPRALSWKELESRLDGTGFALDAAGARLLMRLAVAKFVELHRWNAPVANAIAERPRASAAARQEIETQVRAITLLHSTVQLEDPVARRFLTLVNGTRDRGELAVLLKAEFPDHPAEEIEKGIEPGLEMLRRAGFLEE